MNEITKILNEGGAPVFTTYAVEIGDSLWCALYDYIVGQYPDPECDHCSMYRIEGIYEEGGQKFAILHDAPSGNYFRLNFAVSEEGFSFEDQLIAVEKEFVPVAETPQFEPEAYSLYVSEYAKNKEEDDDNDDDEEKCPKCGKPLNECECDEEEDKKGKYVLEEIPEYMELSNNYAKLETKYSELEATNTQLIADKAALETDKANLETQLNQLNEFKLEVERKEKQAMINDTFYMLSEEDKKDVVENIDTYSLADIEAKLSILCVRNKVSFNKEDDGQPSGALNYNLGEVDGIDDSVPAWIKAVLDKQKNM